MAPENLRYTKTHEWVKLEGRKAVFGITDFAVKEIKDIVYLDLPPAGTAVKAGDAFGAVETVKAAFDIYAPVSGTVKTVNAVLAGHPETVSGDPYGAGWMVEIEATDAAKAGTEAASLMDAAAYAAHCGGGTGH